MTVRAAEFTDADVIAHMLGELGYASRPDEVHDRLGRIAARPDAEVLVAMTAGEIVGVASYQVMDLFERPHPQCRITTLVVKDAGRRRGVATALVRSIESAAREHKCFRLEVTTTPERVAALSFYTGAGFDERPRRLLKYLDAG